MRLTMIALAVNTLWPRTPWQQDAVWWAARQAAISERLTRRFREGLATLRGAR